MDIYQSLVTVNPVTLIAQIGNLFITLLVFRKYFWNKVLAVLDQRREAADREIADAQAAREEAMTIKTTYERNMRESREKADALLAGARQTAALRSEEILRDAQQTAVQIRRKAEADIAQEKKKALNDARNEISDIAMAIAGKVVGRAINAGDQSRLIEGFINELGEQI